VTLRKRPDWRARLSAYIAATWAQPFGYGRQDCALFAAGAIEAMTGTDPAAGFRGRYATRDEGMMLLFTEDGAMGPIDLARRILTAVPPAFAQAGDIAVVDAEEGRALGVVAGPHVYLAGVGGLVTVPLAKARAAFRVPE
jgi:hypothetical protein